ncbi:MAG: DUF2169 domain-containing protein [Polyangiaceae bacterium]
MDLEGLDDGTRGVSVAVPMKDKHGRDHVVAILTYRFMVDPAGRVELAGNDEPPRLVDEPTGPDVALSSIRRPSMLYDYKPGTDVVLAGHAYAAPRSNQVDVSLRMGPIDKTVRAYGTRVWQSKTMGGMQAGPARPIVDPIPLVWELAWGGYDDSDPSAIVADERNYLGRGVARDPASLIGKPAAQLEDPDHPIGGFGAAPASFGPLHRHWQPRASFVGTYDALWQETKMPLLPDDFDDRFHVAVTHDQWSPRPLRGDEPIEIVGATPEGRWRFQLPRINPGFSSFTREGREEHRTHLDSVVIDADTGCVELTWRAKVRMPRKLQMLDQIVVFEKELQ